MWHGHVTSTRDINMCNRLLKSTFETDMLNRHVKPTCGRIVELRVKSEASFTFNTRGFLTPGSAGIQHCLCDVQLLSVKGESPLIKELIDSCFRNCVPIVHVLQGRTSTSLRN